MIKINKGAHWILKNRLHRCPILCGLSHCPKGWQHNYGSNHPKHNFTNNFCRFFLLKVGGLTKKLTNDVPSPLLFQLISL